MSLKVSFWAGRIFGTNTGNLFLEFSGEADDCDTAVGIFRMLDDRHGIHVFGVDVRLVEGKFRIIGEPDQSSVSGMGELSAEGALDHEGKVEGSWKTVSGHGGTFVLFPHNSGNDSQLDKEQPAKSSQLYTKRQPLGPINIDRSGILSLSKRLSGELEGARVVVTIEGDTQQSMFLEDFETSELSFASATFAKLHIQHPEMDGLNRVLSIEFGQNENFILAQSTDESWAVGVVIRIQRILRAFELPRIVSPTKFGVGVNQIILLGAIAYLPSIASFQTRILYLAGVVLIVAVIHWANVRMIPNASISLESERISAGRRLFQKGITWVFGLIAVSLATFFTSKIDDLWKLIEMTLLN